MPRPRQRTTKLDAVDTRKRRKKPLPPIRGTFGGAHRRRICRNLRFVHFIADNPEEPLHPDCTLSDYQLTEVALVPAGKASQASRWDNIEAIFCENSPTNYVCVSY